MGSSQETFNNVILEKDENQLNTIPNATEEAYGSSEKINTDQQMIEEEKDINVEKALSEKNNPNPDELLEGNENLKELTKTPSESPTKLSSNLNLNTEIDFKDREPVEEEKKDKHEDSPVKPDSPTTTYLKNLMLLEEKMFNILEVNLT